MGAKFHCLPLQEQGAYMERGKLLQSKADKAGDESPGEDCGPPQTVGVNGRFPVWLCLRQRHDRQNLCSPAAARASKCRQDTLRGYCRPGEFLYGLP